MKQNITFSFYDAQLSQNDITNYQQQLRNYVQDVVCNEQLFNQTFPFVKSLYDQQLIQQAQQTYQELQQHNPKIVVVVGIGGSSAGSQAIIELLHGVFYHITQKPPVYFADTTDALYIQSIFEHVQRALQQDQNICVIGISKSGKTIESIANLSIFAELLKAYKKDTWHEYCVLISDKDSPLSRYAQKNNIKYLSIPQNVGGRYSVFTTVGLLPLLYASVNIDELFSGAQSIIEKIKNNNVDDLLRNVATLFTYYQSGQQLWNLFVFGHNFEYYGKWWRQLVAESLAKENTLDGQQVSRCLVPNISVGTVDLHSMAQLYLVGCAQQYTTFVIANYTDDIAVEPFEHVITQQTSLHNIIRAASTSMMQAYQEQQLAYTHIYLSTVSEETIGQLMMMDMVQVVLLGYLMKVDAFDQPHVELYKKYMRGIIK